MCQQSIHQPPSTTMQRNPFLAKTLLVFIALLAGSAAFAQRTIWTKEQANAWYAKQPWLTGANYVPQNAINQLEMWQADTFDPATIDKEMVLAASIGFNSMRVFLHDKLWAQDPIAYARRIEQFLAICAKHNIRPMLVLFDSVWDPNPKLGRQPDPRPGVHNSGWVQGPGAAVLQDTSQYAALEKYVKGVVGRFRDDARVLAWDVWNEPDNTNDNSYGAQEPKNKVALVEALLPRVFEWSRAANPSQPLTCGVWKGDWSSRAKLSAMDKIQLDNSDVISFHNYDNAQEFEKRIKWLQPLGRPILCTEYMSRGNKSTFEGSLPIAKKYNVAAYNWGLVAGKSNTIYAWSTWKTPAKGEPDLWFHDIFRPDGRPYRPAEIAFIRQQTGVKQPAKAEAASSNE